MKSAAAGAPTAASLPANPARAASARLPRCRLRRRSVLLGRGCGGRARRRRRPARLPYRGRRSVCARLLAEHPLRHRQRIDELVGDDDRGRCPGRYRRTSAAGLPSPPSVVRWTASSAALLSTSSILERRAEFGNETRRAQRIAHQRAASRPQLDEPHGLRRAHLLPDDGTPQPDELAEHLADLRRGDEVAGAADGGLPAVVAVLGILQAGLHVVVDADRAVARDARREFSRQWPLRLRGRRSFQSRVRARYTTNSPSSSMGIE